MNVNLFSASYVEARNRWLQALQPFLLTSPTQTNKVIIYPYASYIRTYFHIIMFCYFMRLGATVAFLLPSRELSEICTRPSVPFPHLLSSSPRILMLKYRHNIPFRRSKARRATTPWAWSTRRRRRDRPRLSSVETARRSSSTSLGSVRPPSLLQSLFSDESTLQLYQYFKCSSVGRDILAERIVWRML